MEIKPKVTISLITYNGEKYIPFLLPSIQNQTYKDWELMILDNGSGDDTIKAIKNETLLYKLLEQRINLGFAKAHNKIISWSQSEYLLVINQDIFLEPDFIAKLVDFMDQHPKVASVGGKLLYWNFEQHDRTNIIDSCGLEVNNKYHFSDRLQGQGDENPTSQAVFGLSGALVMYRRSALEAVKTPIKNKDGHFEYFDEDFFMYKEDIDLAWRLRLNGWENYFLAEAKAYHDRSLSSRKQSYSDRKSRRMLNFLSYRNHLLMIKKNSFLNLRIKQIFSWLPYEIAKFFYLLLLDRSSLKGLNDYLRLRSRAINKRKYIKKIRTITVADFAAWFNK